MRARSGIFAVLAAAFVVAASAPAFAQESDLDPLAKKFADRLKTGPARVIIAGFLDSRGLRSPLGMQLASEFFAALHRTSPGLEAVPYEEFNRVRKEELWTERDARDFAVVRSLAAELSARLLITGNYERQKDTLRLTVQAFDFRKDREVARASATLALTAERVRLDEQVFELRRREKDPRPPKTLAEYSGPVYQPGKDGVGFPECQRCPEPAYTQEARAEKYTARVLLRIVVTPEGRAVNIRAEKSAKYGLTEAAVRAVEKWKFKPARRNGQPVPVEVMIEVTFRLV
jgi:TonB family protein